MLHHEMAAYMLAVVPAGGNIFFRRPAKAVEAHYIPPEAHHSHAEIGLAAARLSRQEAEPLAQEFYMKYEGFLKSPEPGFRYPDVYDLKTKRIINKDYLRIQDEIRAEFKQMGFEILPS